MNRFLATLALLLCFALPLEAAQLLTIPKVATWDATGNPLTGGKLYTYVNLTTTPKATYANKTLTTPLANPIVLNSRGEYGPIYLDGVYSIELKTAAGATIWTQDDVTGQGSSILDFALVSEYANFSAAVDALCPAGTCATPKELWVDADVTLTAPKTIPAGLTLQFTPGSVISTGAHTLTINGHIESDRQQIFDISGGGNITGVPQGLEVIYPEWWGAVSYATPALAAVGTNSTTAINASGSSFINASLNHNPIRAPISLTGFYRITNVAISNGNIDIRGNGRLACGVISTAVTGHALNLTGRRVVLRDFWVAGSAARFAAGPITDSTAQGIFIDSTVTYTDYIELDGIYVTGHPGAGVHIRQVEKSRIANSESDLNNWYGWYLDGGCATCDGNSPFDSLFENVRAAYNTSSGFYGHKIKHNTFIHLQSLANGYNESEITFTAEVPAHAKSYQSGPVEPDVKLQTHWNTCDHLTFIDPNLELPGDTALTEYWHTGIYLDASHEITVLQGAISNQHYGIVANNSRRLFINDPLLYKGLGSPEAGDAFMYGIVIQGASSTGADFIRSFTSGGTMDYPIYIASAALAFPRHIESDDQDDAWGANPQWAGVGTYATYDRMHLALRRESRIERWVAQSITQADSPYAPNLAAYSNVFLLYNAAADCTIGAPTNMTAGDVLRFRIKNSSGGARNTTWNAAFEGVTSPQSINNGVILCAEFWYDGTSWNLTSTENYVY